MTGVGQGFANSGRVVTEVSEEVASEQGMDEEKEPPTKDLREEHFCQKKACAKVLNGLGGSRYGMRNGGEKHKNFKC